MAGQSDNAGMPHGVMCGCISVLHDTHTFSTYVRCAVTMLLSNALCIVLPHMITSSTNADGIFCQGRVSCCQCLSLRERFNHADTQEKPNHHRKSRVRDVGSPSVLLHVCIHNTISLLHVFTCRSQGQSLLQSEPPVSSLGGIQTRPARWQWSAGSSQALWCWVTAASSSRSCTMAQRWLRLILRLQLAAARARIGR